MITEQAVKDKMERMIREHPNFTDPTQIKVSGFAINLLQFIMGLRGEPVLVPKPGQRSSR